MLLDDFFEIINLNVSPEKEEATVQIKINPEHHIFDGHFPGTPVVPGVCIIQIIKVGLSRIFNTNLMLIKGNNIKYQNMLLPASAPIINIDYKIKQEEGNIYNITSRMYAGDIIFCTFKGVFENKE